MASLRNPKAPPGYYENLKYLGKRVRDVGRVGLDRPEEFLETLDEILEDYKAGRINEDTARGRLLLLYRLTFPSKNSKVRSWDRRTRLMVRSRIREAMRSL